MLFYPVNVFNQITILLNLLCCRDELMSQMMKNQNGLIYFLRLNIEHDQFVLNCESLLLFSVLCDRKWIIFRFWAVGQTEQVILSSP